MMKESPSIGATKTKLKEATTQGAYADEVKHFEGLRAVEKLR